MHIGSNSFEEDVAAIDNQASYYWMKIDETEAIFNKENQEGIQSRRVGKPMNPGDHPLRFQISIQPYFSAYVAEYFHADGFIYASFG